MPRTEYGLNETTGLSGAESRKAQTRAAIDAETSAAILAGFDFEVAGETLHFSVDWNAYRTGGELVRLTLTADQFLGLDAGGALAHKAACMAEGGARKEALETGGAA